MFAILTAYNRSERRRTLRCRGRCAKKPRRPLTFTLNGRFPPGLSEHQGPFAGALISKI